MKKSLLALAVLGAFAGAASAQSSVTIYGQVDAGLGKYIGSDNNEVIDGSDSRIGFRGTEDVGGGLKAVFQFEHRFDSGTGELASSRFWHGIAMVGLSGNFGQVGLGRQYSAAWPVTNAIDPWGDDTVAGLRSVGILPETASDWVDGDGKRSDNSVRYDSPNWGGFSFAAAIAEAHDQDEIGSDATSPWSISGVYSNGPLWLGAAYQQTNHEDSNLFTIGGKYKFGAFGLNAGYSQGKGASDDDVKAFLIAGTFQIGSGELRVGYAESKDDANDTKPKQFSLGYHYNLSKRTTLYADVAQGNDDRAGGDDEKTGYDIGIKHKF